jgi:competence protein ComEA
MSSSLSPCSLQVPCEPASRREPVPWVWPAGARGVLAAAVIAAALGLTVASQSVPRSAGAGIVVAPDLLLDLNTAPPGVLETLPHVGPTLVRQLVAAREIQPLASLEDAGSRVRGLGPATLAQIAPYLRFEPSTQLSLDDIENPPGDRPAGKSRASRRKTTRSRKQKSAPLQPRLVSRSSDSDSAWAKNIDLHRD